MIQLRQYQVDVIKQFYECLEKHREAVGTERTVVIALPTGSGKCHGKGTPILMFDGSIKPVEDVVIGDLLMGDDSTPRVVKSLARGSENLYQIIPVKGDPWVCNESHILSLRWNGESLNGGYGGPKRSFGEVYDIPLKEWLSFSKTQKHCLKQYRVGVEFPAQDVRIDPYILGIWLGDGTQTRPSLSSIQPEVKEAFLAEAESRGLGLKSYSKPGRHRSETHSMHRLSRSEDNSFLTDLRSYGLTEAKRIPHEYLANSREIRLELLAGLLDTDGYMGHGGYEIAQVRKDLASDILFLARSLGFAAYCSLKNVNGTTYYRMSITGKCETIPLRVPRKQASPRRQVKSVLNTGFSVEPLGVGDYYGFEIDGNHRYLLSDFTVTHNTVTAGKLIKDTVSRGERALFLVSFKTLLFQSVESFSKLSGLEVGIIASGIKNPKPDALVQVASIDTIVNRPKPEGVALVIIDEAHTAGFAKSQRWIFNTNADGDWLHWDKKAWVVGLTATPKRTKKSEYLGQVYSHLVAGPTPIELMAVGEETEYREGLCPAIYKGLLPGAQPDLSSVKTRMGDYAPTELDRVVNTPEVTNKILDAWEKLALPDGDLSKAKLTLFFGTSLKHAEAVANAFNARFRERAIAAGFEDGQIFKFLEGDDSSTERKFWFEKLSTRQILGLSSVDILSVGFDVKEVEVVIPRPTKSEVIQEQQEGRGARVAPHIGKRQFIVFDIGLNSLKLGRIDDPKVYSIGPKATSKGGQVPQKQCPECGEIVPALLMECPSCHYEFPKKEKENASGNLVTLESKEDMKGRKVYQRAAGYGRRKGYLPGYAAMRFVEETKTWKESPKIVVGDLLLVEKDRFVKFVGYASAGRVVQTRVKQVVAEEDGLITLVTGNGRICCSPEETIAVGQTPKKEWKSLAIYGEDTAFNRRDYLDFLKAKAKEKNVKNPESWIKNHFITEFTTWQAEPLEA